MTSKAKTRHASGSKMEEYLGTAKDFLHTEVPTLRDCLRLALFIQKENFMELEKGKTKPIKDVLDEVVKRIFEQWQLSNVLFKPPVTIKPWSVQKKLKSVWVKISDMVWHRTTPSVKQRTDLEEQLDRLLDIVLCKCPITVCTKPCRKDCLGGHSICFCPRSSKVPEVDLSWLHAQRQKVQEKSSLAIAGIDMVETNNKLKTEERKQKDSDRLERKRKYVPDMGDRIDLEELDEDEETAKKRRKSVSIELTARMKLARQKLAPSDYSGENNVECLNVHKRPAVTEPGEFLYEEGGDLLHEEGGDLLQEEGGDLLHEEGGALLHDGDLHGGDGSGTDVRKERKKRDSKANKMPIPNTAAASVRFGTSQGETAAITTGFLLDLIEAGHLPPEMAYLAVNKDKVARGKTAVMKMAGERGEKAAQDDEITAIFFDGRKDKTQVWIYNLQR